VNEGTKSSREFSSGASHGRRLPGFAADPNTAKPAASNTSAQCNYGTRTAGLASPALGLRSTPDSAGSDVDTETTSRGGNRHKRPASVAAGVPRHANRPHVHRGDEGAPHAGCRGLGKASAWGHWVRTGRARYSRGQFSCTRSAPESAGARAPTNMPPGPCRTLLCPRSLVVFSMLNCRSTTAALARCAPSAPGRGNAPPDAPRGTAEAALASATPGGSERIARSKTERHLIDKLGSSASLSQLEVRPRPPALGRGRICAPRARR
jgi:hypothetical protein